MGSVAEVLSLESSDTRVAATQNAAELRELAVRHSYRPRCARRISDARRRPLAGDFPT